MTAVTCRDPYGSFENPLLGGGGAACGSGGGFVVFEGTHPCTAPAEGNAHFHATWTKRGPPAFSSTVVTLKKVMGHFYDNHLVATN